ncbi:MAG: hypothetical protein QM773_06735 [Hyphomonadaceae bacterium]
MFLFSISKPPISRSGEAARVQLVEISAQPWAYLGCRAGTGAGQVSAMLETMHDAVLARVRKASLLARGPARARFLYLKGEEVGFDIGIPIAPGEALAAQAIGMRTGFTYSGPALRTTHAGPHAGLGDAYAQMEIRLASEGLDICGSVWEIYLNGVDVTASDDLRTEILWPCRSRRRPNDTSDSHARPFEG